MGTLGCASFCFSPLPGAQQKWRALTISHPGRSQSSDRAPELRRSRSCGTGGAELERRTSRGGRQFGVLPNAEGQACKPSPPAPGSARFFFASNGAEEAPFYQTEAQSAASQAGKVFFSGSKAPTRVLSALQGEGRATLHGEAKAKSGGWSFDCWRSSSPTEVDAAAQFLQEVDSLVAKHRFELGACFDSWLRRPDEPLGGWQTVSTDVPDAAPFVATVRNTPDSRADSRTKRYTPDSRASSSEYGSAKASKTSKGDSVEHYDSESGPRNLHAHLQGEECNHAPTMEHRRSQTMEAEIARHKKKKKHLKKPFQELLASRVNSAMEAQTFLQRIFASRCYELVSAVLILSNALFMGVQTQYFAQQAEVSALAGVQFRDEAPPSIMAVQIMFTVLFSLELFLRWFCDGPLDFFGDATDRWWNILDVWVVFLGIMDLVLEHLVQSDTNAVSNISVLKVMRVIRVVRVARVIRIMKFFRELRMMIYSILGSMKSLLWVIIVLAMTFYVFGITFTAAATAALDSPSRWFDAENDELRRNFSSLDKSVLSLFMAMSGGNDWGMYYDSLAPLQAPYKILFLIFISFAVFAVVNIVTGVFVETALQSNTMDRQIIVHEELEAKKAYLKSLREVFDDMDEDDSGSVSLEEFEAKLDDERVIAYFNALKLDVSDARTLFWLLDYDHSDEVNIDEFLTGCYKLQGESRTLDMKLMQCEVHSLRDGFDVIKAMLTDIQECVNAEKYGKQDPGLEPPRHIEDLGPPTAKRHSKQGRPPD